MKVTNKQRFRMEEIARGGLSLMYRFAIKTDKEGLTKAEKLDIPPGDYIEQHSKIIMDRIENRIRVSLIDKDEGTFQIHPFVPENSDLHRLRGIIRKLKKWDNKLAPYERETQVRAGYNDAISDILGITKRMMQNHPINHLFQDKACIKCRVPFVDLATSVPSQRGYVHNECPTEKELKAIPKEEVLRKRKEREKRKKEKKGIVV